MYFITNHSKIFYCPIPSPVMKEDEALYQVCVWAAEITIVFSVFPQV